MGLRRKEKGGVQVRGKGIRVKSTGVGSCFSSLTPIRFTGPGERHFLGYLSPVACCSAPSFLAAGLGCLAHSTHSLHSRESFQSFRPTTVSFEMLRFKGSLDLIVD